jgi:hypothetical protein
MLFGKTSQTLAFAGLFSTAYKAAGNCGRFCRRNAAVEGLSARVARGQQLVRRRRRVPGQRFSALLDGPMVDAFSQGQLHHHADLQLYVIRTMLLGVLGVIGMRVHRPPFPILNNRTPRWRRAAEARRIRVLRAKSRGPFFADVADRLPKRLRPLVQEEIQEELQVRQRHTPAKRTLANDS